MRGKKTTVSYGKRLLAALLAVLLVSWPAAVQAEGGTTPSAAEADGPRQVLTASASVSGIPALAYVGERGTGIFTPDTLGEIEPEAEVRVTSPDESVFRIDGEGNWEAVSPGYVELSVGIVYSEATMKQVEERYGDVAFADVAQIIPVRVDLPHRPVYRLYNPNSGEHFYTMSAGEQSMLGQEGWRYEGIGWYAPEKSDLPVYRLYNPNAGDHHYTMNAGERDMLTRLGWRDEGIAWYSDGEEGVPLYRQYNPNAVAGTHNYTASKGENDLLASVGWREEGIAWYGCAPRDPADALCSDRYDSARWIEGFVLEDAPGASGRTALVYLLQDEVNRFPASVYDETEAGMLFRGVKAGYRVEVLVVGGIAESYPAQARAMGLRVLKESSLAEAKAQIPAGVWDEFVNEEE